ncbi:MAG TPA: NAD(P)H-hydrate dehydratase [Candidatus Saccharimonadales bacterium]|nr:NAD(P)H-hydrate dehydratase [Candidatus Saccharimonadales bacterium]
MITSLGSRALHNILHRPKDANKYDFGHVLIFGGSPGMVGAPLLAGEAALRMGAGLVTIASDERAVSSLDRRVEEIMTLAIPSYAQPEKALQKLAAFVVARKVSAVIIGPGLQGEAAPLVRLFVSRLKLPIVLDAGGLAAFQSHLPELQEVTKQNNKVVITPHSGEYIKLSGVAAANTVDIQEQAAQFANSYRLTLVLKGPRTLVAHPDGVTWQNDTGNPGMATAGTGDVLSGIIAGLLAQGIDPAQAVELGVHIHGLAGDRAARAKTEAGMIASDLIEFLPEALKVYESASANSKQFSKHND